LKTKMSRESMRFCKLLPSLACVLLTVKYGTRTIPTANSQIQITSSRCKLFCGLFVVELIPCREAFKVPVTCGGNMKITDIFYDSCVLYMTHVYFLISLRDRNLKCFL